MREGLRDVGIVGDKAATLDENAQSRTEFVEVGGRDHPADGVQVFVGEAGALDVDFETEEDTRGVAHLGFSCVVLRASLKCNLATIQRITHLQLSSVKRVKKTDPAK